MVASMRRVARIPAARSPDCPMNPFTLFSTVLAGALLASCTPEQKAPDSSRPAGATPPASTHGRMVVYVANYPLAYFAERIGGPEVEVKFPAPPDVDPAFWEPTEAEVEAYQSADVILLNGASYSHWLDTVTLPDSKTVNTSAAFSDKFIVVKDAVTHSHGGEGEHSHSGTVFTTWIDFDQAIQQADAVREAFQAARTSQVELFALNFDQLKADLLALDREMKREGARLAGQPLVVSHPIYQYWARRYGLNVQSVLWEPGTVPDEAQIEALKKILATHPVRWMVWEGTPAKESVERLKDLGVNSVVFNPAANVPEKGTWLDVMKANLQEIKKITP